MKAKYGIYSGGVLIGSSNLENADPSMGVQGGQFYPEVGYTGVAHIYQEFSVLALGSSQSADVEEQQRIDGRLEELRAMNRALDLRAEDQDGRLMETAFVDISDLSPEFGDEGHEVRLWFADGDFYRQFFPYDEPGE